MATPSWRVVAAMMAPYADEMRALVGRLRSRMVQLFAEFGAASNQIGKTYPYLDSLSLTTGAHAGAIRARSGLRSQHAALSAIGACAACIVKRGMAAIAR